MKNKQLIKQESIQFKATKLKSFGFVYWTCTNDQGVTVLSGELKNLANIYDGVFCANS